MMENREYLNSLFDIYKDLLTEIEQVTFKSYYEEDLSLSEIAELRNISKSSVGKTLKGVEDKLKEYERILHNNMIRKELLSMLELDDIKEMKERITKIYNE